MRPEIACGSEEGIPAVMLGDRRNRAQLLSRVPVIGRQKTAPRGAVFGVLSTAPQHVGPHHFRLLRQALSVSSLHCTGCFLTPPSRKGPILAPRPLTLEMDFSRSLVGHGLRYIWDSVPICLSPSPLLPYSSSLFELGCFLSFQPNPGIQS